MLSKYVLPLSIDNKRKGLKMNKIKTVVKYTLKGIIGFSLVLMVFGFSQILQVITASSSNGFIFINDIDLMNQFGFGLLLFISFGWVVLISFFVELKLKLVA